MRASEFITEEHEPTQIKLGNNDAARAWIDRVYTKYPQTFQNNHVMPLGGTGDDQQFAMFELIPSFSKRGAVEVKWFQAYPLRQGVGSRAIQELQAMAREDGISLTLYPWDKGQISQAKLTKFYKGQGFKPTVKGAKNMAWTPEGVAEGLNELTNTSLKVKQPKDFVNTNDRKQVTWKVMKFKSGKDTYLINFTMQHPPAFGKKSKSNWNAVNVSFGVKEPQDDYSFGDEINTDLTAKNKNQFLIYSTVINAIRKFITEYNTEIDEIIMQGAGERQEAIYQRFFQSAGKYFPGWHYDGKHSLVRDVPRQQAKKVREQDVAEGTEQSLLSMVSQDQSERNEYKNFVKSQAGGDWSKGAKMYAQLKKRPSNDIFGDAARLNQFMKMKFDFDKFTDEDWDNYWLLAQHCDDNRDFQKNALSIIKKYQGTDHSHYKYLYDRISMGLTGKQKYGTQNIKKQGVAEGSLNEYRDQLWTWVQSKFPRTQWPEYVQRDFLYAKAKGNKNQKDLEDFLDEIQRDFGNCKWTLTKIPITLDIFTPKTQRMIQSREGGSSNPFQVPKDAERHAQQSQMIQQKGVSAEPIIVAKLSNGYDLIEGWHRTIQHLKAFPQGYTGPAWVCTGATYKSESVNQGVVEGEVVPLGKKHRGDLDSINSCSKCGGKLEGGTYMGQRIKVCLACKQVYLPPNSGIDQQGNKIKEQGVAEGLDEAVGGNYLYHATMPAGMMRILRTGIIKATDRPQSSTKSKTQYPTISTTRSKQYAESNDFVDFLNLTKDGNSVILVFDRTAVANHYKMFSTSQGTQTVGDEYEEVIVAPKGSMPIKGTLKGFYFNPRRTEEIEGYQDVPWFNELLNSPYYMGQKQGVAEGNFDSFKFGKPITFTAYHSSDSEIKRILPTDEFYFSDDRYTWEGNYLYKIKITLKNPYVVLDQKAGYEGHATDSLTKIKAAGYDGVIYTPHSVDYGFRQGVCFYPQQQISNIKLVNSDSGK